ncbi:MAG TPA: RES family NAD+ phosphorylase [Thermoanaerobaculia bacterium]|nr:RES family NAD+ phosphorylase [Thermoanaerobaculia bacterium]
MGTGLWRLYFRRGNHPVSWNTFRSYGPAESSRFDHQISLGGERGILYTAQDIGTCLAEVFQKDRLVNRTAKEPWLVGFELISELVLLDLTALWSTRAGASMAINTGRRDRARRWSRAIYEAYPAIQGLYYPSSMYGNRPSLALYERAAHSISSSPFFHRLLADPVLRPFLGHTAQDIGYRIV